MAAAVTGAIQEGNLGLAALKTIFDPRTEPFVATPGDHSHAPVIEQVTFELNFETLLLGSSGQPFDHVEGVSTRRGLVIINPMLGSTSIWHYGLVPVGAVTANTNAPWSGTPPYTDAQSRGLPYFISKLKYGSELALPYGLLHDKQVILVTPNLGKDFTRARMFSAVYDVQLTSVDNQNRTVPIAGVLAAAAVHSTTDVAQVGVTRALPESPDVIVSKGWSAYAPANLMKAAVTTKDAVSQVLAQVGVAVLQGCDIPGGYKPPDDVGVVQPFEQWTRTIPHPNTGQRRFFYPNDGVGASICLGSTWISPWDIHLDTITAISQGMTGIGGIYAEIPTAPIEEMGTLKVKVEDIYIMTNWNGSAPGGGTADVNLEYLLEATHIFAFCDGPTGAVYYRYKTQSKTQYLTAEIPVRTQRVRVTPGPGFPAVPNPPNFTVPPLNQVEAPPSCAIVSGEFDATPFMRSMPEGKYLGTLLEVKVVHIQGLWPPRMDLMGFDSGVTGSRYASFWIENNMGRTPSITISAPQIYTLGREGPARVIRYDNLSTECVLRINGKALVQCIPNANFTTFVSPERSSFFAAANVNIMPLLARLFNGPNPVFRRVYTRLEYLQFILPPDAKGPGLLVQFKEDGPQSSFRIKAMSVEELNAIADDDESIGAHMSAAGLYNTALTGINHNSHPILQAAHNLIGGSRLPMRSLRDRV